MFLSCPLMLSSHGSPQSSNSMRLCGSSRPSESGAQPHFVTSELNPLLNQCERVSFPPPSLWGRGHGHYTGTRPCRQPWNLTLPPSLLPRPFHLRSQTPTAPPPGTTLPGPARATTSVTGRDHHTLVSRAAAPPPLLQYLEPSDAPTAEHRVPRKSPTSTRTATSRRPPASIAAVRSCATLQAQLWLA